MIKHRPSDSPVDWVGMIFDIEIDRMLGSKHPRYPSLDYPVNYGYVPRTSAPDGHEIDAYVLGVDEPLKRFRGECIAIICREDDVEDKLVIVPVGLLLSDKEISSAVAFQEKFFKSKILRN